MLFAMWLIFVVPSLVVFIISGIYCWISRVSDGYLSYEYLFSWIIGDMPYWYYLKSQNYIGLYKTIKEAIRLDFYPDEIKYDDIDTVCRAVRNSASEIYPILLNKQAIDDIKFLYRNKIYVGVWPKCKSDSNCLISVPYEAVSEYIEKPKFGGTVQMTETRFLEICEKLKKNIGFVKVTE